MIREKTLFFGIVDVGTNAVRFEVYRCGSGAAERLFQWRKVLRLGEVLHEHGCINPESLPELYSSCAEFAAQAAKLKVSAIRAVGTSVFREAKDTPRVTAEVLQRSGINIEVVSGRREAQLIRKGILAFEDELPPRCLFVDIGGGSSELSAIDGNQLLLEHSLSIGAIGAQRRFLESSPPAPSAIAALREQLREQLSELPLGELRQKNALAVGSSGTARALGLLAGAKEFSRSWLQSFIEQIREYDHAQLRAVAGMKEERIDIILAGAVLLEEILSETNCLTLRVSEYSLRHGLLAECVEEFTATQKPA